MANQPNWMWLGLALLVLDCGTNGSSHQETLPTDGALETDVSADDGPEGLVGEDAGLVEDRGTSDTSSPDEGSPDSSDAVTRPETSDEVPGCALPNGYLDPVAAAKSSAVFAFRGVVNASTEAHPTPGMGTFAVNLRGQPIDVSTGSALTTFRFGDKLVLHARGSADPATGKLFVAEFRIAHADLAAIPAGGHTIDVYGEKTDRATNVYLYEGWVDKNGDYTKLCTEAVPGEPTASFFVCQPEMFSFKSDPIGQWVGLAGNISLFDDRDYLARASGMPCACPNGVGRWRNCSPGVPESYGLLRINFTTLAGDPNAYFSKYIYDESRLFSGNEINPNVINEHREGFYQSQYPLIYGGLNTKAYGTMPDAPNDRIYQFDKDLTIPVYASSKPSAITGLVSHDSSTHKIIIRQQAFPSGDGSTPAGLWVNLTLPDSLQAGQTVTFGSGPGQAQAIVFEPVPIVSSDQGPCIIAVANAGQVTLMVAENLTAAEGGKIKLYTENNGLTRFTLELFHPSELPAENSLTHHLTQAGLTTDEQKLFSVCTKI